MTARCRQSARLRKINSLIMNRLSFYRFFILLLAFGIGFVHLASAQVVAVKTNAMYWASASPNLSAEVGLSPHWTLEVGGGLNPFTFKDNLKWKHSYHLTPTHPFRLLFHYSAVCAWYFLPPNWTVHPTLKLPLFPYLPSLCFQSLPMKSDPFFKVHLNCPLFRESSESSQFVPHSTVPSCRTVHLNPSVMFINQSEPWFSSFLFPQCINAC